MLDAFEDGGLFSGEGGLFGTAPEPDDEDDSIEVWGGVGGGSVEVVGVG